MRFSYKLPYVQLLSMLNSLKVIQFKQTLKWDKTVWNVFHNEKHLKLKFQISLNFEKSENLRIKGWKCFNFSRNIKTVYVHFTVTTHYQLCFTVIVHYNLCFKFSDEKQSSLADKCWRPCHWSPDGFCLSTLETGKEWKKN